MTIIMRRVQDRTYKPLATTKKNQMKKSRPRRKTATYERMDTRSDGEGDGASSDEEYNEMDEEYVEEEEEEQQQEQKQSSRVLAHCCAQERFVAWITQHLHASLRLRSNNNDDNPPSPIDAKKINLQDLITNGPKNFVVVVWSSDKSGMTIQVGQTCTMSYTLKAKRTGSAWELLWCNSSEDKNNDELNNLMHMSVEKLTVHLILHTWRRHECAGSLDMIWAALFHHFINSFTQQLIGLQTAADNKFVSWTTRWGLHATK
jgi:hypothetical protein